MSPRVEHRTGGSNLWATPRDFAPALLATLRLPQLGLDLAAEPHTALAQRWYGAGSHERTDALAPEPWAAPTWATRWLNPPYSRQCLCCPGRVWTKADKDRGVPGCAALGHGSTTIEAWIERACVEGLHPAAFGSPIVVLVPARTGAAWYLRAAEAAHTVVHVTGRLRFLQPGPTPGELVAPEGTAAFDSVAFVFAGPTHGLPYVVRHVDPQGRPVSSRRGYSQGEVAA